MDTEFYTLQQAADHLGKSTQTVRRMIKRGELKAKRVKTPQGFQYVVEKEMFSNSPIQNHEEPLIEELKAAPTYQVENLTNQNTFNGILENDFYTIDIKEPIHAPRVEHQLLLEQAHKEKMALLFILEQLQRELEMTRRRPHGFFDRLMDWLFG